MHIICNTHPLLLALSPQFVKFISWLYLKMTQQLPLRIDRILIIIRLAITYHG